MCAPQRVLLARNSIQPDTMCGSGRCWRFVEAQHLSPLLGHYCSAYATMAAVYDSGAAVPI